MVILMLLVWQFNSLRKPAIVLATILFALVGSRSDSSLSTTLGFRAATSAS